jgi:hypothetical protein
MEQKKIFLGSSIECKGDMLAVAQWIKASGHIPKPWDDDLLFQIGGYTFSELFNISQHVDAAILIFGDDDLVWYRNDFQTQARTNVVLEYGLFAGTLGLHNTIICRKGQPKIPSNLDGIIYADLNKPVTARKKILKWIDELKSKSTLEEIQENILTIEKQQSRSFQQWLFKEHLKSALEAIKPIGEQMGGEQHGAIKYDSEVRAHTEPNTTDTILALCGNKFKKREDNIEYFRKFYTFAKERKEREPKHNDGIYMCRIFIQGEDGKFADHIKEVIKSHRDYRDDGVLALTIKADKRPNIEKRFDERFCKCLDDGFGFLLFYKPKYESVVITHEGVDNDLAFFKLKDKLNLYKLLQAFTILCRQSEEYQGRGRYKERDNLDKMLRRLQLRVRVRE